MKPSGSAEDYQNNIYGPYFRIEGVFQNPVAIWACITGYSAEWRIFCILWKFDVLAIRETTSHRTIRTRTKSQEWCIQGNSEKKI